MDSYHDFKWSPTGLYDGVKLLFERFMVQKLLELREQKYEGISPQERTNKLKKRAHRIFTSIIDDVFPGQRQKKFTLVGSRNNGMKTSEHLQLQIVEGYDVVECIDEESMRPHAVQEMLCHNVHGQNEQAGDNLSERLYFLDFNALNKR